MPEERIGRRTTAVLHNGVVFVRLYTNIVDEKYMLGIDARSLRAVLVLFKSSNLKALQYLVASINDIGLEW
jgi:hypothetical protein